MPPPFFFSKAAFPKDRAGVSPQQSRYSVPEEPVFRPEDGCFRRRRRHLHLIIAVNIRHNSSAQNPKSINSLIRQDLTLKKCKLALDKTKGKYANY
ncbi:hypothetical protein DWW00_14645 [Bacteroides fragilis]|uniref:Uncharacterized protein n=1 Tax=Bacteroides fragilis TaxID=817 RepID=A0A412Y2Z5_BACFG|nr:hypothetical protein DWW08_14280 [Bacteroides fragilis]RGV85129.1 hypothetical protein DWW00_14645 [Bacteroides fragilis]